MTEWETIEDNEEIKAEFRGYKEGMVRLREGGWALLPNTAAMIDTYKAMPVKPSDVWVVTQPKCGTTWTQEMVWQIANNVDIEGGKAPLGNRFPFLEVDTIVKSSDIGDGLRSYLIRTALHVMIWWDSFKLFKPSSWLGYSSCAEMLNHQEERRFIKSHLPLCLLPPSLLTTAKVIYVARNPKDQMVSFELLPSSQTHQVSWVCRGPSDLRREDDEEPADGKSLLPPPGGGLAAEEPSQHALPLLRGHEEGPRLRH